MNVTKKHFTKTMNALDNRLRGIEEKLCRTNELLSYIAYMMILKENPHESKIFTKEFREKIQNRIKDLVRRFDP